VKGGGVLPEGEGPKGEGSGAGVQPLVELVRRADVDLADVARALLRPGLLDDVEVSVPSTIAELESPLHFDAMIARNTSGYIAVGVGIWPGKPPQVSPLLTVGTPQVARNNYSDAMLFPIVTGSRAVKSGLAPRRGPAKRAST
jgi:hypothetical protein